MLHGLCVEIKCAKAVPTVNFFMNLMTAALVLHMFEFKTQGHKGRVGKVRVKGEGEGRQQGCKTRMPTQAKKKNENLGSRFYSLAPSLFIRSVTS